MASAPKESKSAKPKQDLSMHVNRAAVLQHNMLDNIAQVNDTQLSPLQVFCFYRIVCVTSAKLTRLPTTCATTVHRGASSATTTTLAVSIPAPSSSDRLRVIRACVALHRVGVSATSAPLQRLVKNRPFRAKFLNQYRHQGAAQDDLWLTMGCGCSTQVAPEPPKLRPQPHDSNNAPSNLRLHSSVKTRAYVSRDTGSSQE